MSYDENRSNRHRGEGVSIPMRDGTRHLIKIDLNALAEMEGLMDIKNLIPYMSDPKRMNEIMGFTSIRAMIYASMRAAGCEDSLEDAIKNVDLKHFAEYSESIKDAMALAWGGNVEAKENPKNETEPPSQKAAGS